MYQSKRFLMYGVFPILGDSQIKNDILRVCEVFGYGSNNNAHIFIAETIQIESDFGTAIDYSKEYGEGLSQFDKGSFKDTINRTSRKNKAKALKYFGFDLDKIKYEHLRTNPLLCIVLTRLKYLLVTAPIPLDKTARYEYYKTHWNGRDVFKNGVLVSKGGKSTLKKWNMKTQQRIFYV